MFQLVVLFFTSSGSHTATLNFESGQERLEATQRIRRQAEAQCRNVEFYY